MTIRELYIFAQSHTLLDKSVGLVIDEYIKHISVHNNTLAHSNIMNNQSNMPYNNNYNNSYSANEYDERITKLERQIRRLDERLRKLESGSIEENITDSNLYMI